MSPEALPERAAGSGCPAVRPPFQPLAIFQVRRTERVRLDWPMLQPVDAHRVRLLDRTGSPLAIPDGRLHAKRTA